MLALPTTTLAVLVPFFLILQIFIAYIRNPLRKIPAAHPLAPFTSLWIDSIRWRSIENATLKAAHARAGPIVCLGPNEVSVNCVKGGIRDVYAGGFEKGDANFNWYAFFSNYKGVDNMFSIGGNKAHSKRKRMLSNIYSKSVINASEALRTQTSTVLYQRFLPYLHRTFAEADLGVLNINALLNATTMDIVTAYLFGLKASSNFINNPKQLSWFLDLFNSRRSHNFWPQEFPRLTAWAEKWFGYRLSPSWVDDANVEIEKWTQQMCEKAGEVSKLDDTRDEDLPVVFQQLIRNLSTEANKDGTPPVTHLASEVLDHLAAGFDTSAITLAYVVHELSRHKDVQLRLQRELVRLSPRLILSAAPDLPDSKALDALPFLHAVIWETLRLHSAIPGPQPRVTPAQGCHLGPDDAMYFVPGGVRISASAGLLHLNEDVYENASEWWPDRWLMAEKLGEEKRKDMESRWFWAFGSGGRMCVGSHLAVYQMKYIVATLYSNYGTTIIDDTGIEQTDSYTAPPKSDKLMIKLEKITDQEGSM